MTVDSAGREPIEVVDGATHGPFRRAWSELEQHLLSRLVDELREGLSEHRSVTDEIGLASDPGDWMRSAESLAGYRRSVGAHLLERLITAFEAVPPCASIADTVTSALEESVSATDALPPSVVAPWPEDALEGSPHEGWRMRIGKAVARRLSSARKSGEERSLPLRALALRHLERRVAPAVDGMAVRAMETWVEWLHRLELAWVKWGDTALPALVRADLPDVEGTSDDWATIRDANTVLVEELEALAGAAPLSAPALEAGLGALCGSLAADLAIVGSFLLNPSETDSGPPRLRQVAKTVRWRGPWEESVGARLRLYVSLQSILAGVTAVQQRLVWRFREKCLAEIDRLPQIASKIESAMSDLRESASRGELVRGLEKMDAAVQSALVPAMGAIAGPSEVDTAVREGGDATVEALLAMIRQAPSTLSLHAESERVPARRRRVETRSIDLQELARQSFDALRIERIRSSTVGLIDAVDDARKNVSELPEVFAFAYEAAKKELDADGEEASEPALGLISEAVQSMAESLRTERQDLDQAVQEAQGRLAFEISEGALGLLDRIAAGRMTARLLAARSRAADLRAWINETWGPPVDRAFRRVVARLGVLRRLASKGLRRGSAMVGAVSAEDGASTRSVKELSDTHAVTDRLPLVYQRLFALEPVSDPALLAGRSKELGDALRRWNRWRSEDGVPLIVRGRHGNGISSLLNVLCAEIESRGGSVRRATLAERVRDEAMLTAELCPHLGLPPCTGLDELAAAALAAPEGSLPDAIAIDNLEHVYLRAPHGTDVVERFLTFMAETEPCVFWIGGITASAWQVIAAAEPTAVSQVDVLDLLPLDSAGMREAVTMRHRRSGLQVRFAEPATGRHLLRRRLRRMRDARGYQDLLEEDFFDHLYRASSGHLQLALFQWLQVADFRTGNGGVAMRPPERPDFSILEALDLTQNFTLKAFLEHRSLTLEEHNRVFRLPRQESYQIFESLQNRHLIEVIDESGEERTKRSEIQEGLRYRVRPLLVGAVINHLRGRNIVH
jgi:hypothetical protein